MFAESDCARQMQPEIEEWYEHEQGHGATWQALLSYRSNPTSSPSKAAADGSAARSSLKQSREYNRDWALGFGGYTGAKEGGSQAPVLPSIAAAAEAAVAAGIDATEPPSIGEDFIVCMVQQGDVPDEVLEALNGDVSALQSVSLRTDAMVDTQIHAQGAATVPATDLVSKVRQASTLLVEQLAAAFVGESRRRKLEKREMSAASVLFEAATCAASDVCGCVNNVIQMPAQAACGALWNVLEADPAVALAIQAVRALLPHTVGYPAPLPSKEYKAASISVSFSASAPASAIVDASFELEIGLALDDTRKMCFAGGAQGFSAGAKAPSAGNPFGISLNVGLFLDLESIPGTMVSAGLKAELTLGGGVGVAANFFWPFPMLGMVTGVTQQLTEAAEATESCDLNGLADAAKEGAQAAAPDAIVFTFDPTVGKVEVDAGSAAVGRAITCLHVLAESKLESRDPPDVMGALAHLTETDRDVVLTGVSSCMDKLVDLLGISSSVNFAKDEVRKWARQATAAIAKVYHDVCAEVKNAGCSTAAGAGTAARAVTAGLEKLDECTQSLDDVGGCLSESGDPISNGIREMGPKIIANTPKPHSPWRRLEGTKPSTTRPRRRLAASTTGPPTEHELNVRDFLSLTTWFALNSLVTSAANTSALIVSSNATSTATDWHMHMLPSMPSRERIDRYLRASGASVNASASGYDWDALVAVSQVGLDQIQRWQSYSETMRGYADPSGRRALQLHVEQADKCLQDPGSCDYLQEVNRVINALLRQRRMAVLSAVEDMYKQSQQFSFWSLQPVAPVSLDPPNLDSITRVDLQDQRTTYASTRNALISQQWQHGATNSFSYTFDVSEYPSAIRELQETGTASFVLNRPSAERSDYSYRYIHVRAYLLPTFDVGLSFREVILSKQPYSNFTQESGSSIAFRHYAPRERFQYEPQTCEAINQRSDPDGFAYSSAQARGIRVSPFGLWSVSAKRSGQHPWTKRELSRITRVRFEFKMTYMQCAEAAGLPACSTVYPGDGVPLNMDSTGLDRNRGLWCQMAHPVPPPSLPPPSPPAMPDRLEILMLEMQQQMLQMQQQQHQQMLLMQQQIQQMQQQLAKPTRSCGTGTWWDDVSGACQIACDSDASGRMLQGRDVDDKSNFWRPTPK